MAGISFDYPLFLFLLLLIPIFILIYFSSIVYNKKKAIIFSNFEALERISDIEIFSKGFITLYLNLALILFVVLAITGVSIHFNANTSTAAYVILIDNSESMNTNDVMPDRLGVAKTFAKNFVDSMPIGSEIGVIVFAGYTSVLQNPESSKIKTKFAIESIEAGESPGTNLYNAIVDANVLLGAKKVKSVLLISDGQLNLVDSQQIIDYAQRNNIMISCAVVGTVEGGMSDLNVTLRADESMMRSLALDTQGTFFRITNSGNFEGLVRDAVSTMNKEVVMNISFHLLIASLVIILLNWILYNFRFRIIP